jgi:hypothetical protein
MNWEGWAAPAQSPAYYGVAITDWRALSQALVFVILGVAMAVVLGGAARSARCRPAASPRT